MDAPMITFGSAPHPDDIATTPQWWYACLYTGGMEAADDVIAGLLPPLLAEVRALGASRWFFIRYFDESGPHIRLRVFGPGRSLDRLVRTMTDLGAHLELIATAPRARQVELVPGAAAAILGSERRTVGQRVAVYEPEIDKYGGLEGVEIAEQMFEFSSELALWGVSEHEKGRSRDGLAALLLADTVGALCYGARAARWERRRSWSWRDYWMTHADWWTGARTGAAALRDRLERHASAHRHVVHERMRAVAAKPDVNAWRRRWFRAMDDYLATAGSLAVPRTPQHLAFHQNHMLMNRLGYLPREEALLGMHARDWMAPCPTEREKTGPDGPPDERTSS
ncbi:hypothetical protein GCM10022219_16800 [Microbacterium oryzae]|uniref:lantibiotic dehydratase C-terminal domain-containing protein n=1 Tax=Microbacterium oryzae TaxID=743009 RepID=UPI001564D030|nr:lantibiotic dehydratase C-terminal domain-containing protein [Microbacterium oryzae]